MEYTLHTNRGIEFTIPAETINQESFLLNLNNQQLLALSISGIGLNKRNILVLSPTEAATEGAYRLSTTDRKNFFVDLEEGDSVAEVVRRVNDRQNEFVKIGDVILQSRNFDFIAATE